MNWSKELKAEREALKRIIALFLSLARLADLAAGRCHAIRCVVLWCLRRAEPIAWDQIQDAAYYAEDAASCQWADDLYALPPVLQRNSRAEAQYLALIFRTAARMLQGELQLIRNLSTRERVDHASADACSAPSSSALPAPRLLAAFRQLRDFTDVAVPLLDTS